MNPYQGLDSKAFWRSAVADKSMFDISDLWQPKFKLTPEDPVSTYGSCFAQHIGRALKAHGYTWLVTETAPQRCPEELAKTYNYGIFSARTANIYTTTLLLQWTEWAQKPSRAPAEAWEKDGRFIDPFRPQIEPNGFASREEMMLSRLQAIRSFRESLEQARYFVFTMGLTESWRHATADYEYPMCPGTAGGTYSAQHHRFVNLNTEQVSRGLLQAFDNIRAINPQIRFILTVSPVPLTATASGKHVLVATVQSKSILRAVAAQCSETHDDVDYFPSYEIITGTPFCGTFFEPNKRNVHPAGVEFVMKTFFTSMGVSATPAAAVTAKRNAGPKPAPTKPSAPRLSNSAEVCEESLLAAFGSRK